MFIFGGSSRLIVSVINSFAGAVLVIVVYRLAKELFDFQTARITALLMTFWLSFILLSAGTSKEMLVICIEWSLLYLAIRNQKGLTQKDILVSAPLLLTLYTLRFYAFYICAGALFIRAIITNKKYFIRNSVLGFLLVASLFMFLNASGVVERDFTELETKNQNVDNWRTNMAKSTGSGTDVYREYRDSALATPLATVYFFLAPFPWQIFEGSVRNSFAAVENIVLIIFFVIGFRAIKVFFKERFYQLLPIIAFCVIYAGFQIWGLSNLGLAWRHKQTVMPLFFLLLAVSLTSNFGKDYLRLSRK
jgi:4-amino-4-deoxy-L-arabinose transferase-like glycosyltransferase